jgi:DNA modification methylase
MAAERAGRICHGIEIDPAYVDVAIRRWQKMTGEAAIHSDSEVRFDGVAALKGTENV